MNIEERIKEIWGPCHDTRHPCPPGHSGGIDCEDCRVQDTIALFPEWAKEKGMVQISPDQTVPKCVETMNVDEFYNEEITSPKTRDEYRRATIADLLIPHDNGDGTFDTC